MDVAPSTTICAALADATERLGDLDALSWAGARRWRTLTWLELIDTVTRASVGLAGRGLRPGTLVPVLAAPSVEQTAAELAVIHAGAVSARLPAGPAVAELAALSRSWPVDLAVVDSADSARLVHRTFGAVTVVVLRRPVPTHDMVVSWDGVLASGHRATPRQRLALRNATGGIGPSAPASLVTDGDGDDGLVVVSHGEVICAAAQLARRLDTRPGDRVAVALESARTLQRTALELHALLAGATRYVIAPSEDVCGALRHARPTVFVADAGAWAQLAAGVRTTLASRNGMLDKALAVGRELARLVPGEMRPDLVGRYAEVASALAGVRADVGLDECRLALACEPLPHDVEVLFRSIGLPIDRDRVRHVSQLTSARGSGL